MLAYRPGNAYACRRRHLLQARSDIDAVAQQIVTRHNDVTQIDADTELQAAIPGDVFWIAREASLDFDRAPDSLNSACELGDKPVTRSAEDAAIMLAHYFGDLA